MPQMLTRNWRSVQVRHGYCRKDVKGDMQGAEQSWGIRSGADIVPISVPLNWVLSTQEAGCPPLQLGIMKPRPRPEPWSGPKI